MFPNLLPLGLVDLTLARTFFGLNSRTAITCALGRTRAMHQATLPVESDNSTSTAQSFLSTHNRPSRGRRRVAVKTSSRPPNVTELAQRVQALQETVVSEESILNLPAFSEEELLAVYDDLLSNVSIQNDAIVDKTLQLPSGAAIDLELETYAQKGDVQKVDELMKNISDGRPSKDQRDLHIKAHTRATPAKTIPTSALSLLHSYEIRGIPAPMKSYTRVITALFRVNSSIARAHAWDLFSHMRYVAHPQPDALLYALMIRACAHSNLSTGGADPLRALDLWTEMTVDQGIAPTAGAYGAIILACACSGEREYVNEAFRLAKEMLDSHRDAQGRLAFKPDANTFRGLLEGAKRIGDLGRARWILAEMVKPRVSSLDEQEDTPQHHHGDAKADEKVLIHMFHAYASYKPPFKRSAAVLLEEPTSESSSAHPKVDSTMEKNDLPTEDSQPQFSHIPPQTPSEIIGEVKALFNLLPAKSKLEGADDSRPDHIFNDVRMTPALLNAYLSVYYAHAPLNVAQEMFTTLFPQLDVKRTPRSYTDALTRCGIKKRGNERTLAMSFAEDLWKEWTVIEDRWRTGDADWGMNARMIERAYTSMIRILSLNGHLERAVDLVKSFFNRYPSANVGKPSPKPDFRSTRTVLVGARPLVRMTSSVDVPDDDVPPLLTFSDVELLHHRLVAARMREHIGFLTYLCKSYEGALRRRRDSAMRAEASTSIPEQPLLSSSSDGARETDILQ